MSHIHGTERDSAAKEDRPRVRAPALRTPGSVVLGKEANIPHASSSTKFKNRPNGGRRADWEHRRLRLKDTFSALSGPERGQAADT